LQHRITNTMHPSPPLFPSLALIHYLNFIHFFSPVDLECALCAELRCCCLPTQQFQS
jgi:hypothetical protein